MLAIVHFSVKNPCNFI